MKSKEFYIGYLAEAPEETSRFIRTIILIVFILLSAAAVLFALNQNKFSTAVFEYGSGKEYTGIYTSSPVPAIKISNQKDVNGKNINLTIPLVGYGKHGAEDAITEYEKRNAVLLNGKQITVKGDLIYNEKTFLSLNEGMPIVHIENTSSTGDKMISLMDTVLKGEIIDPKCYFGVMKPGLGKVHRECAIRCISGGIPPVFRVNTGASEYQYYLLLGVSGERINEEVLPYVADKIRLHGKVYQWGNWLVLQADINNVQRVH